MWWRGCPGMLREREGGECGWSSGCVRGRAQVLQQREGGKGAYAAVRRIFMSCSTSSVVPERWSTVRSGGGWV